MPIELSVPPSRIRLVINVPNHSGALSAPAMVHKQGRLRSGCTLPATFDCSQAWFGNKDGLNSAGAIRWKRYIADRFATPDRVVDLQVVFPDGTTATWNITSQGTSIFLNAFARRFGAPVCTWVDDQISGSPDMFVGHECFRA